MEQELKKPYFIRGTTYNFTIELIDEDTEETIDMTKAEDIRVGLYQDGTRRIVKEGDEVTVNEDGTISISLVKSDTNAFNEGSCLVQTFYRMDDKTRANAQPSVLYVYEKYV